MSLVSIVCPVHNEETTVPIFYGKLHQALALCPPDVDFELIFVNNASKDATPRVVAELRERDPSVQLITQSRNFGYQASVQAGLTYAAGDAVIVIDADCEDPPALIPEFLRRWREGYDVVYGLRADRPEPWLLKKARALFYHVLSASADMDIILYMAEFSLISAPVREAILRNRTSYPFLRSEIGYVGFSRYGIPYKRQPRVAGKTHYNLIGMTMFALAGILTASTVLLRAAAYAVPPLILVNFGLFWFDLAFGHTIGFRASVLLDLIYIMLVLAVISLYTARIYKNGMRRPNFIVNLKASLLNRPFPAA